MNDEGIADSIVGEVYNPNHRMLEEFSKDVRNGNEWGYVGIAMDSCALNANSKKNPMTGELINYCTSYAKKTYG